VETTFADRLWWSRHKAGLGATRLARMVECSQSLISGLERNNAKKSQLSNKFAAALKVDPTWLAVGNPDRAPPDFDAEMARRGRMTMGSEPPPAVRLPTAPLPEPSMPRWMEPTTPPIGADGLWKQLVNTFIDYAALVGEERAKRALDALRDAAAPVFFGEAAPSGE
jgi:transcriptional regulator with XRE-family HTH domain